MLKPIQARFAQPSQSSSTSSIAASASKPTRATIETEKETLHTNTTQPNSATAPSRRKPPPNAHPSDTILNQTVREALQAQLGKTIQPSLQQQSGLTIRMILNEATGGIPSQPNQMIKIAGQPAEMAYVYANHTSYWGYSFLNGNHIVLTTGVPTFSVDGGLKALNVSAGQMTIRYGTQLKSFKQLDLIAGTINIEGEIHANKIDLLSGAKQVNYTDGAWTNAYPTGPQPLDQKPNQGGLTLTQQAKVCADSELSLSSSGRLLNQGRLEAKGDISLKARSLENHASALIDGRFLTLTLHDQLKNRGVIQGSTVAISAQSLINDGTEDTDEHQAGAIIARRQLTIGAQTLHNQDHGLVHSDGELTIGGSVNAQGKAQDSAQSLSNTTSSTIESREKLLIHAKLLDNSNGQITASSDLVLNSQTLNNSWGHIEVSGDQSVLDLQADTIDNTSGRLIHTDTGQTQIVARHSMVNRNAEGVKGAGSISSQGPVTVTSPHISNDDGGTFFSDQSLKIKADSFLNNQGTLHARDHVWIEAGLISNGIGQDPEEPEESDNPEMALLNALLEFTNQVGSMIQKSFQPKAYLITGNTISISAQDGLMNTNAVIFAQNSLEIGAECVNNFEQSVLYSDGHLAIGGQLDTQLKVRGVSEYVFNYGSTIDALGDLVINAKRLVNANEKFKTKEQVIEEREIHECHDHHTNQRYDGSQIGWHGDVGGLYRVQHSGVEIFCFTNYHFTRRVTTTVVTHSEPGNIQAGGAIRLSGEIFNNKSRIIAGGALSDLEGGVAPIKNLDAKGQRVTTDQGTSQWSDRDWHGGMFSRGWSRDWSRRIPYHPAPVIEHHNLNVAVFKQHTAVDHQAPSTALVVTSSPFLNSGLQHFNLDPNQPYLIQTDPRFARNSDSVSSNLLLKFLNLDPQRVPKRLGDGFYEQQLIRDQIIGLTGHYYLSGYQNWITEFKALMHRGANWAKQHHLTLGIESTPQQIAALSASPVWLVNQRVKLPDGSEQTVLMPKIYLAKKDASPVPLGGSLISANTIELHSDRPLKNAGTMISRGKMALTARNMDNQRGAIVSLDTLSMQASDDIDSRAGQLFASKKINLKAGHEIHLQSQTQTTHAASGSQTALDAITQVQAEQLEAYAESDLHLAATQIKVDENASLEARGDLTLGTATVGAQHQLTWDGRNRLSASKKTEVGSLIQTGGALELKAGRDIHAVGAHVNVGEALSVKADRDINVAAAHEEADFAESHYHESSNFFSSSSELTQNKLYRKQALSTTFSGDTVKMEAGHDLSVTGSNIIGMHAVGLYADNDIKLNAEQQIEKASHYSVKERSGLLDSGSLGFTIGERQQKDEFEGENTPHIGTVIGSVSGYIQAIARREYHQSGSQLVAPEGNIEAKALKGSVDAVYEQSQRWQHNEWHQSGLTVSVGAPVIAAAQTGQQMLQASTQVSDTRMHALAASTIGLGAKNAYDAIQADPKAAGGVTVSAMIGESHQEFQQTQLSTTALGSAIKAGGTVRLDMKGLGEASTLAVIGSQIEAKQDVELNLEGPLNVEAALNTFSQHSERHNQSSAVGVAATFGTHSSVGASATISHGRGHTDGIEVSHTPAQIKAGRTLMLNAQSDVHLKGAQLSGQQVQARIGGDLEIESVQSTNSYDSHYQSISGSATAGPTSAASINFSQQKIDSTYRSVAEQAGIQANDGGFQIKVKGDTKLVGGVIASTDQAIAEGKNQFVTATLVANDIANQAKYDAQGLSLGAGYSSDGKNVGSSHGEAVTPAHSGNQLASRKGISPSIPIAMSASGTASSTTQSTISGAQIVITDETRHKALTGQSSEETLASLNRDLTLNHSALAPIFNQAEIEASFEIVEALGREVNTFIQHRAKEADRKIEQAKNKETIANENALIPEELRQQLKEDAAELRVQAKALNKQWGPGGLNRRVLTALTAAASGNVTGTTAQFVQSGVVNLIQQQGASYIGELVQAKVITEGSPAHATLHALVAVGGAVASNQSLSASAIGGATSSLLTNLFTIDADATQQEQEAKRNLLVGLVTGIAAAVGQDPSSALTSASIAIENNWLATEQKAQVQKELEACEDSLACKAGTMIKRTGVSAKQDALTMSGLVSGLAEAGWKDVEGLVEFFSDLPKSLAGLASLVNKEVRDQIGEALAAELDAKIRRMQVAVQKGGDQNAVQLGRDLGNLIWQVGSITIAAAGVTKLTASLGKAGVRLGKEAVGEFLHVDLVNMGGQFSHNAKPLLDFEQLAHMEKCKVGEHFGGKFIKELLPDAQPIARVGASEKGIDALYRVNKNGVDYVIVEYKYDKSKLGNPIDGPQMSNSWLLGKKTGNNRILKFAGENEAPAIVEALYRNRLEKWFVHTSQFGKVNIGLLDENAKLIPYATSKLLGKK